VPTSWPLLQYADSPSQVLASRPRMHFQRAPGGAILANRPVMLAVSIEADGPFGSCGRTVGGWTGRIWLALAQRPAAR
jgi:hypothetical protein